MNIIDVYGDIVVNPDLTKGRVVTETTIKEDAIPLSDDKLVWDDDDYVTVNRYVEYSPKELAEISKNETATLLKTQMETAVTLFVSTQASTFSDGQALTMSMLFPEWLAGVKYSNGRIVRYKGCLYRIIGNFTSQDIYPPDVSQTQYKKIEEPTGGIFPWVQPLGSEDAYSEGDRVTHKGKTWVSIVPGTHTNTWEPGVYGWNESK